MGTDKRYKKARARQAAAKAEDKERVRKEEYARLEAEGKQAERETLAWGKGKKE